MNKQSKLASWQQLLSDSQKLFQVESVQEKPKGKESTQPVPEPVSPIIHGEQDPNPEISEPEVEEVVKPVRGFAKKKVSE